MNELSRFRKAMAEPDPPPAIERGSMTVETKPACHCGCGLPDRIELTIDGARTAVTSAAMADRLLVLLILAREATWGEIEE